MKFRFQDPFLGESKVKNSKLCILSENWWTWYLECPDSDPRLRFLISPPHNSFLGKFTTKNSKLSVFSENWFT